MNMAEKITNTVFKVYSKKGSTGVEEDCLITKSGDYIGIKTGNSYSSKDYYHSKLFKAEIISVDMENHTGMLHLYGDNSFFS